MVGIMVPYICTSGEGADLNGCDRLFGECLGIGSGKPRKSGIPRSVLKFVKGPWAVLGDWSLPLADLGATQWLAEVNGAIVAVSVLGCDVVNDLRETQFCGIRRSHKAFRVGLDFRADTLLAR